MILRRSGLALATIPVAAFGAWAAAALAIDGPATGGAATLLAVAWLVLLAGLLASIRPYRNALLVGVLLNVAVVAWWLSIEPSNDRPWLAEVERPATVRFDGDLVHIANVRDFRWRSETDFTPAWEERTYDLGKIRAADLFFSNWGPPLIEHTIMSWEFEDGQHLAVSIETRKEIGEQYSALLGFFRQFELYYVVADERDVIALRTNVRGEHVRMYRLSASPQRAREVLVDYLEAIDELSRKPKWYNALTQNCTTTIVRHIRNVDSGLAWDWRMLANGSADALLYLRGSIDNSLPYAELRGLSDVTEAARRAPLDRNFSADIRKGLPRMDERGRALQGGPEGTALRKKP